MFDPPSRERAIDARLHVYAQQPANACQCQVHSFVHYISSLCGSRLISLTVAEAEK
jgi:hypothetical protein